jgi:transcriptional regulator with XRE-family HTH domain
MFGDRVKEQMEKNHMTQKELAEKAQLTEVSLSRYIRNQRTPDAHTIAKLSVALGCRADYLLEMESDKQDPEQEYYRLKRVISRHGTKWTNKQKADLIKALIEEGE